MCLTVCWALHLTEDWQCLNAKWQLCNRGSLQQSCNYDLLFPLNHVQVQPEPADHERCVRCVLRVPQLLEVIWLSDRGVVGTDVQRKCDRESIRSAAWNCSGLFRQSTINPYQLDRMHIFSLRRQQTAPEYLLQTSQMNELGWTLLPQCTLWIGGKFPLMHVARMLNWSE